jgi:hypothetical protein
MAVFSQDDRDKLTAVYTILMDVHPEIKENTRMRQRLGGILVGIGLACTTISTFVTWLMSHVKGH